MGTNSISSMKDREKACSCLNQTFSTIQAAGKVIHGICFYCPGPDVKKSPCTSLHPCHHTELIGTFTREIHVMWHANVVQISSGPQEGNCFRQCLSEGSSGQRLFSGLFLIFQKLFKTIQSIFCTHECQAGSPRD
jgi:hypothetical protein